MFTSLGTLPSSRFGSLFQSLGIAWPCWDPSGQKELKSLVGKSPFSGFSHLYMGIIHSWLVVWNSHIFWCFPYKLGRIIIPTDELHHFSEGWRSNHPPEFGSSETVDDLTDDQPWRSKPWRSQSPLPSHPLSQDDRKNMEKMGHCHCISCRPAILFLGFYPISRVETSWTSNCFHLRMVWISS